MLCGQNGVAAALASEARSGMIVQFAHPIELHRYAERNGLAYAWEFTRAFAKWQGLLTPEQYELVEVRTSLGISRAMLFPRTVEVGQKETAQRERWRAL